MVRFLLSILLVIDCFLQQIIDSLVAKHENMTSRFHKLKNCELNNNLLKDKLKENKRKMDEAIINYKKIESLYQSLNIQLAELQAAFYGLKQYNFKLEERIKEAVMIIKDVIGVSITQFLKIDYLKTLL